MTEKLLQFIWQFQYFNKKELTTTTGDTLQVINQGLLNTNQGPDFLDAKIRIAETTWAGSVELHLETSGWQKHKHESDRNYNNVVLHVVWEDDENRGETATEQGAILPILELKDRVSKILLQRYEDLMNASFFIPCERTIQTAPDLTWKSWKDRLLAERLMRKAKTVENFLQQNNYHWEETCWWLLARNFGIKVNADAFESMARSIPLTMLAKEKKQLQQVEALLLGQAGLLSGRFAESYPQLLQKEYRFQSKKHRLRPIAVPVHFLRMRPGNFPTIRIAQLAMLVHGSAHLFSKIKEASSLEEIKQWFDVIANDYWHYHYRFDQSTGFKEKKIGQAMIDNIIVNTICPLLFAYGNYYREQRSMDKAIEWFEKTAAENNFIMKGFNLIGIACKNAFDSQALIELKNEYCDKKRCLECAVGNFLLKT